MYSIRNVYVDYLQAVLCKSTVRTDILDKNCITAVDQITPHERDINASLIIEIAFVWKADFGIDIYVTYASDVTVNIQLVQIRYNPGDHIDIYRCNIAGSVGCSTLMHNMRLTQLGGVY